MPMLSMPAILAEIGLRSHASIYAAIQAGLFTKPVRISQRAVAWPSEEVTTIIAARIAGKSEDELRTLIEELHRRRAAGPLGLL